jgi:hypothetical protein
VKDAGAARTASLGDLLDAYRLAAMNHRAASLAGEYKAGNPQADIIARIYHELRRRGPEAQNSLLDLINDDDPGVRAWAAAHVLEIEPERGVPVLEALAQSEPWPANTNAETTLQVWRKGELKFP